MNRPTHDPAVNLFVVSGQLVEFSPLRYTPAGVAVCEFKISHSSEQVEAGLKRIAQCQLDAIAVGPLGNQVSSLALGVQLKCSGFIAHRSIKNQRLRFHVCQIEF